MLYEYCINNNLSKDQILAVLKEYDSTKKFETNNVEDVQREVQEKGPSYVSSKYGVKSDLLKQYPGFRFKKRDKDGKKRQEQTISVAQEPVFDLFGDDDGGGDGE